MRFKISLYKLLLFGGGLLCTLSILLMWSDDAAIRQRERVVFENVNGDSLLGFLIHPENSNSQGILLLEGFGSDQVTMRSAANEFARAGFTVFTFDFSGHGRSEGTLGFDNAASDIQAQEVLLALEVFKKYSGLDEHDIFLLGHSLGGRAAVQAMLMDERPLAGLILLGPQISLETNQQAEFFTGISDVDLDWVQQLGPQEPDLPLLILTGEWEDILPYSAAELLMQKLTGETVITPGEALTSVENGRASREWQIISAVPHNFEVYSAGILKTAKQWTVEQSGIPGEDELLSAPTTIRRWGSWLVCVFGIFMFAWGAVAYSEVLSPVELTCNINCRDQKKFLFSRFWLWLPAMLVGILILLPFFFLDLGIAAFNLYYFVFIGGYGLLNLVLYWLGWMPGIKGKLVLGQPEGSIDKSRWKLAWILNGILALILIVFYRSGWFWTPPVGNRLVWFLIFIPIAAVGFYITHLDNAILKRGCRNHKLWTLWAGYLPFLIYAILLLSLGSWSGLISSVMGLGFLFLIQLQGRFTLNLTGNRWFAAILQASLLCLLIMPQGVLFHLG